jgi:hypothetical protein
VLRISCQLSSDMAEDLCGLFARAAACPELIVDMRNFEGMGTLLLPEFAPLVARKNPAKWLASRCTLPYLQRMGVPEHLIEMPPESPKPHGPHETT